MLPAANATPLFDFLDEAQRSGLTQPVIWMQIFVLVGFGFASWLISRALKPRIRAEGERKHWRFGTEGVARVLFPLTLWLSTEAAEAFWRAGHSVTLLRLAASLFFALVIVRAAVYLLQAVFAEAEWVRRYERTIAGFIWLIFVLQLTGVLPLFADQLEQIGFPVGHQHVTLLMVINGLFSVALTLLIALWFGRLLEARLMSIDSLNLSLRVVLTKVLRTLLVVVAVLIALPLVGIDLTVLSVFGGALGVGLGFGLQKVASNYVSGFIILLDGSIRIGDLVSIDTRQGTITKITARYVVLKLGD
ncbi:MAG: mechanosensitive ion channel, partial [Burkholderiales bacterium]|nr:mechanosensitive ion channel [Burkholderiales bacterium]